MFYNQLNRQISCKLENSLLMFLYIIRLKEILNNPSLLDLNAEFLALNSSKKPPILIYGRSLGEAVLKSKDFIPSNLIEYFKAINNIPNSKFPFLERYFKESPLFLNDINQARARESLLITYKKIEENLIDWLPAFTKNYLNGIRNNHVNNPIKIAEDFTNGVFKKIILMLLECEEELLIDFPDGILNLYKSAKSLEDYEQNLKDLFAFIEHKLIIKNNHPSDAWKIISVLVMGYEPILNSLAFSMSLNKEHEIKWNAENFLMELSPISFVVRLSTKALILDKLNIQDGQAVYVSLNLINHLNDKQKKLEKNNSFSFGMGKHMCPGRRISLIIVQAFIDEWINFNEINVAYDQLITSRDLVFRLKENV